MPCRDLVRILGGCLALLAVAACEVDATVTVRLDEAGGGSVTLTVRLDEEAVRRAELGGGTLDGRIRLSDLVRRGWATEGWTRDGGAAIELTRAFAGPESLARGLAEVAGDSGVVGDARIVRERGVLRSRDGLAVRANLEELAPGATADDELAERFAAAGLDLEEVERVLAESLADALTFTVLVVVPGGSDEAVVGPGEAATASVDVATFHRDRAVGLVAAAVLGVAGVVLLGVALLARRRPVRPAGGRDPSPDP